MNGNNRTNINKNKKGGSSRWGYTTVAIFLGVTLSLMHTLMNLARSTRIIGGYEDRIHEGQYHLEESSSWLSLERDPLKTKVDFFFANEKMVKRENHYSGSYA